MSRSDFKHTGTVPCDFGFGIRSSKLPEPRNQGVGCLSQKGNPFWFVNPWLGEYLDENQTCSVCPAGTSSIQAAARDCERHSCKELCRTTPLRVLLLPEEIAEPPRLLTPALHPADEFVKADPS